MGRRKHPTPELQDTLGCCHGHTTDTSNVLQTSSDTPTDASDASSDTSMDRLTVAEASARLGVTQAAVYKRIQRGTIAHDKDVEGHVLVYVDASDMPTNKSTDIARLSTDGSMDKSAHDKLIEELRAHNEYLRKEAEAWQEESRRKDAIIMTMAQRIPELEPASEPQEAPETSTNLHPGVDPQGENAGRETTRSHSWWQRFLRFE